MLLSKLLAVCKSHQNDGERHHNFCISSTYPLNFGGIKAAAIIDSHNPNTKTKIIPFSQVSVCIDNTIHSLKMKITEAGNTLMKSLGSSVSICEMGNKSSEVEYDSDHYPRGLNHDFLHLPKDELLETKGKMFWNAEIRNIVRVVPKFVSSLGSLDGLSVADIGAGSGLLLSPLVKAIGHEGKLFCTEVSGGFVSFLKDEVKRQDLRNVFVVESSEKSPCLPSQSIDLAIICDVYHHLPFPKTFVSELCKSLKPGGRLVLVEFHRDPIRVKGPPGTPADWVMKHVRADQDTFRAEIESVGLEYLCEILIEGLDENYVMVFQKKNKA